MLYAILQPRLSPPTSAVGDGASAQIGLYPPWACNQQEFPFLTAGGGETVKQAAGSPAAPGDVTLVGAGHVRVAAHGASAYHGCHDFASLPRSAPEPTPAPAPAPTPAPAPAPRPAPAPVHHHHPAPPPRPPSPVHHHHGGGGNDCGG